MSKSVRSLAQPVAAAAALLLVLGGLPGCAPTAGQQLTTPLTPLLPETTTIRSLGDSKRGVAVMRIAAINDACRSATVTLAQREGEAFKQVQVVRVGGPRGHISSNVGEVELAPGEYHIVSYACEAGPQVFTYLTPVGGVYRRSLASFQVSQGEIVNIGHVKILNLIVTQQVANVAVTDRVTQFVVADWSLPDLESFKQARPGIYKDMRTRLAKVTPAATEEQRREVCAKAKALKDEGKVQNLPAACLPPPPGAPAVPAARGAKKPDIKA